MLACSFLWHLDALAFLGLFLICVYSATNLMFGVLISNLCLCCMLGSLVLAACWVLWQLAQGKKMSSLGLFYHLCVLFCNQSNVWCSYMLACSFLWHLDALACGYHLLFVAACWVLWSWLHVGFFGSGSR